MSRLNFEQEIPGWRDFMIACERQVAKDKREFDTTFFPSVVTCKKPKFCLVAMEPSKQKDEFEQVEKDVKNGRRVFFPHHVTYCVWRYLCGEKYDFCITDLDKGMKRVDVAKNTQYKRWTTWLPLLKNELELLGNPIIISFGSELGYFLDENLKIKYILKHYSEQNESLEEEYKRIKKTNPKELLYPDKEYLTPDEQENLERLRKNPDEADQIIFNSLPNIEDVKNFAKKYREDFGDQGYYSEARIAKIIEDDFKYGFKKFDKIVFALYRYQFTLINKAFYQKGDYDNAIEAKEELKISINTEELNDAKMYNEVGLMCYNNGEYIKAIANYNLAINLYPNFAEAYYNRGFVYSDKEFAKSDGDLAIADFSKAIELKPNFAKAYYERGLVHYNRKWKWWAVTNYVYYDYEKAILDFNRAIQLKPDYAEAYKGRGEAYCAKGEYDKASEDFTVAIKLEPALKLKSNYVEAYNILGEVYFSKGEYEKAIENFTNAQKLKPDLELKANFAEAYKRLGEVYFSKCEYKKAIENFANAQKLKPDLGLKSKYVEAYKRLGDTYNQKNDYDLAVKSYVTTLQIDPNNEPAKKELESLEKKLPDIVLDHRDYKVYKTVKIGEKTWMAQNLDYECEDSKCFKYGRLYDWKTAIKACPEGWRLPSEDEWNEAKNKNSDIFCNTWSGYCIGGSIYAEDKGAYYMDNCGHCWFVARGGKLKYSLNKEFENALLSVRCVKDDETK